MAQFKDKRLLLPRHEIDYNDNFLLYDANTSPSAAIRMQKKQQEPPPVKSPRHHHVIPAIIGWMLISISVLFTFVVVFIILFKAIMEMAK